MDVLATVWTSLQELRWSIHLFETYHTIFVVFEVNFLLPIDAIESFSESLQKGVIESDKSLFIHREFAVEVVQYILSIGDLFDHEIDMLTDSSFDAEINTVATDEILPKL